MAIGHSQCTLTTTEAISTMTVQRCTWLTKVATTGFMVHTMLTCTSPHPLLQWDIVLLRCTTRAQEYGAIRVTWATTTTLIRLRIARLLKISVAITVVLDTSEVAGNSVLLYYMPRNEDSGGSQKWGSLFCWKNLWIRWLYFSSSDGNCTFALEYWIERKWERQF